MVIYRSELIAPRIVFSTIGQIKELILWNVGLEKGGFIKVFRERIVGIRVVYYVRST